MAQGYQILTTATGSGYAAAGRVPVSQGGSNRPLWQTPGSIASLPTRYMQGLLCHWNSNFTLYVAAGSCRDKQDAANMALSSDTIVDVTVAGALGIDQFTLGGGATVTVSNGQNGVNGTGTHFSTDFGTRVLSGTCAFDNVHLTVTGTSTKFLSEIQPGDLIGSASLTGGILYVKVASVESDLSLTISSTYLTGVFSGVTLYAVEQPTVGVGGGQPNKRVIIIQSDTLCDSATVYTANTAANPCVIGPQVPGLLFHVWLSSGGSGTTVRASGQRTNPFALAGYSTSTRRLGAFPTDGGSLFMRAYQREVSPLVRDTFYEEAGAANGTRVVSAGNPTANTWTLVNMNAVVPPHALQVWLNAAIVTPAAYTVVYMRERNLGPATASRNTYMAGGTGAGGTSGTAGSFLVDCDGVQNIEYSQSAADGGIYMDVRGYRETI